MVLVKKLTNSISVVNVPYKGARLILMNHPASLILYKYASISCLSGTVSIMGYQINDTMEEIPIFSSEKSGLIKMKTEFFESTFRKNLKEDQLKQKLSNYFTTQRTISNIMKKLENSTVLVCVQKIPLPNYLEFAEYYYPEVFDWNLVKRSSDNHYLIESKKTPLEFDDDEDKLASEINTCIRRGKIGSSPTPRILVCGSSNTGKSTLLQYLINRALTQFSSVCYLDTDPGQPEFTPPGVVSLTEVTEPLIGHSFIHHDENAKMIFVGGVSLSFIDLDLYIRSVCKLEKLFSEQYSDQPLFVNTSGWMEGIGLQCLKENIVTIKPTILIEIVAEDAISTFDYRDCLPENSQYFQICCKHKESSILSARESQELSLISYLGMSLPLYMSSADIHEIRPYYVSWEKIAVSVFPGRRIPDDRLIEAVNASIVALCSVPETSILESTMPNSPKTLDSNPSDPDNECLAYGLVRSIDEKNRLLHIVSPLEKDKWPKVNAIIKGKVMVPDNIILKQEIYGVPLPYTAVREAAPPDEEMPDVSNISLKYVQEAKRT